MSKEKGILFKGEMVRAILEGRKTQTRRGIKVKDFDIPADGLKRPTIVYQNGKNVMRWEYFRNGSTPHQQGVSGALELPMPWKIGDILYVRETWWSFGYFFTTREATKTGKLKEKWLREPDIHFAADHDDGWEPPKKGAYALGWWRKMSSLFLEKKDARIWLKVTNVRVERLLDISEADAIAEGIAPYLKASQVSGKNTIAWFNYTHPRNTDSDVSLESPIESYFSLWDYVAKRKDAHKDNPWVWVLEFEVIDKP